MSFRDDWGVLKIFDVTDKLCLPTFSSIRLSKFFYDMNLLIFYKIYFFHNHL